MDKEIEELSREIAEWRGECWHEMKKDPLYINMNKVRCVKCKETVPITSGTDYTPRHNLYASSLDLMHEAEMELAKTKRFQFYKFYLYELLHLKDNCDGADCEKLILAPAEVRARAFVKTIREAK